MYVSIDLDCIDPGIAPGVSVPTPGGITPLELIYLIKKVCEKCNVVGLDIVELTPDFDLNNNTANIGSSNADGVHGFDENKARSSEINQGFSGQSHGYIEKIAV